MQFESVNLCYLYADGWDLVVRWVCMSWFRSLKTTLKHLNIQTSTSLNVMAQLILLSHESSHSTWMALSAVGKKTVAFNVWSRSATRWIFVWQRFTWIRTFWELVNCEHIWGHLGRTWTAICRIIEKIIGPIFSQIRERAQWHKTWEVQPIYPEMLLFLRYSMTLIGDSHGEICLFF